METIYGRCVDCHGNLYVVCPTSGFRIWMVPGGILWGFKLGHVTSWHACTIWLEVCGGCPRFSFQTNGFHLSRLSCTQFNPNSGLWGWSPRYKGHIFYLVLGAAPIHRALTRHKAATPFSPLTGWAWCSGWKTEWMGWRWFHGLAGGGLSGIPLLP